MSHLDLFLIICAASITSAIIGGLAALGLMWAMRTLDGWMAERVSGIVADILKTRAEVEPLTAAQKDDLEGALIGFGKLRELTAEYDARLQHVAAGGRWDDSPTKWRKVVTK